VAVAAATVASACVVAGISVGISLGATPAVSSAGQAGSSVHPSSSAAGRQADRGRAGSGRAGSGNAVSGKAIAGKPASGKAAPGKAAPGNAAARKVPAVTAHKSAAPHRQAPARQAPASKPYLIYDSVTPEAIPAGQVVATYATGARPDYPSQVVGRRTVLWIDTLATDPAANALDIEPGCASPAQAAGWVQRRLTAEPHATAILYMSISWWPAVQADVASLPAWMRARIRWWIADPTGTPHIVPGSQATQWYWGPNYDISTALPGF
jgi:hypothetical protein